MRNRSHRSLRPSTLLLVLIASCSSWMTLDVSPLVGQSAPAPRGLEGLEVRSATGPVEIDGRLVEEAWRGAARFVLGRERYPAADGPSPVETECWVTFDPSHLYVAFRAREPDPGSLRAHLADRDQALEDDFVGIALDPFDDERRGFLFLVNPLGVQMDAAVNDVGQDDLDLSSSLGGTGTGEDFSWDALWSSAGRITEAGYVVEMAIPFSSLRFPRSGEVQTWGFDALRAHPRGDRRYLGLSPIDADRSCYLCQVTKLRGFEGMSPGRNVEVVPTVTTLRTDRLRDGPGTSTAGATDVEPGLSLRWGITPNLSLNATLNPDFSQVEADVAQLDVNTRAALFFPEKRPFFLEGNDLFETSLAVVHTRTIADPSWGLKLTGKQGRHAVGAFVADDETTNLLIPGPQGSRSTQLDLPTRDTVARYRRDVGDASTWGLLFTDREGGDFSSRMLGVDGLFRLSSQDTLRLQALGSETRYPDEVVQGFGQPASSLSDTAFHASWAHRSRDWGWTALVEDAGADFRADLGFLPFVDYRWMKAGGDRIFWGSEGAGYTRWAVGGAWEETRDHDGVLLDTIREVRTTVSGPLQSRVRILGRRQETRFGDRLFDLTYAHFEASARPSGRLAFALTGDVGDGIDFVEARPGRTLRLVPALEWAVGRRLDLELRHTFERLELEEGELFRAGLSELRAIYHFNVRIFVRAIVQRTAVARDPELFSEPVGASSRLLFTQLLFSYRLSSQTALLAGYSDRWRGGGELGPLERTDRTFFLKLGYAWTW